MTTLPDAAYMVALASLPGMWPTRLAALLGVHRPGHDSGPRRPAAEAWQWVLEGQALVDERIIARCQPDPSGLAIEWRAAATAADVLSIWRGYRRSDVKVAVLGETGYPSCLAADIRPPYFLYVRGDIAVFDGPRAAIVGTRRCSASGSDIAAEFGRQLAASGVRVVSGLAAGIDGAAHAGALSIPGGAPPIGVVAGGLDRPYPSRHRFLWRQVGTAGALLSEAPLGTPNESWRFPARNRVIAALADVIVVVESHKTGGSMITAEEALNRGRTVLAVPGPIRSPSSAGTNALLRDGAGPACDVDDILAALALTHAGLERPAAADPPDLPRPPPELAPILAAVDWAPTATEQVLIRTGRPPGEVTAALARLEIEGWVRSLGGWWERVNPPEGGFARPTVGG